jgi:hypothetical protein
VDDIVEFIPDDQAKKVTPLVTQLSWTQSFSETEVL